MTVEGSRVLSITVTGDRSLYHVTDESLVDSDSPLILVRGIDVDER